VADWTNHTPNTIKLTANAGHVRLTIIKRSMETNMAITISAIDSIFSSTNATNDFSCG